MVTGHYARITIDKSGIFRLLNGVDKKKDQSYFLYTLDQKKLAKAVFPNGSFFKEETRKLAKKWQLPTKDVVESENICFISKLKEGDSYKEKFKCFLIKNLKPKPGLVVDIKGNVLGTHKGLCFYTIGSRGGWEIKIKRSKIKNQRLVDGDRPRLYVVRIDKKKNQLVVGTLNEASRKEFEVEKVSWIGNGSMIQLSNGSINCFIKVRSAGRYLKAKLIVAKQYHSIDYDTKMIKVAENFENIGKIRVVLEKPELGIAPGQRAVFYQQYPEVISRTNTRYWYEVIGGGVIK